MASESSAVGSTNSEGASRPSEHAAETEATPAPGYRVRSSRFVVVYSKDARVPDIARLLQGEVSETSVRNSYALSAVGSDVVPLEDGERELLAWLPSDEWVEAADAVRAVSGVGGAAIERLVHRGVLISDADRPEHRRLRRRHDVLDEEGWHVLAALFHFVTRWDGVKLDLDPSGDPVGELVRGVPEAVQERIDRHGPPPPHFHSRDGAGEVVSLPLPSDRSDADPLVRVLLSRRTTRAYDTRRSLPLEDLSFLLRYTFGCHGYTPVADGVWGLKKTSPSGGGLHPVEVYPLVTRVEGLEPGVYHYRVEDHALELVQGLELEEARQLAAKAVADQVYFADAHVLFLMTARFYRSHWKYRGHPRAYPVILMDAAHLSQSVYLLATALDLGAFVTAAINGADIERALGIDGFQEGAVLVSGCGIPRRERSRLSPEFRPYDPRSSQGRSRGSGTAETGS